MGKKKKGRKKAKRGKKSRDPTELIPQQIKAMDVATLQRQIQSQRQKLLDTKILRNKFQNEKDLIKQFYDVSKAEVNQIKANIRNLDTQMERLQDDHRVEVKVFDQKIKHLEYDHQMSLKEVESQRKQLVRNEVNYFYKSENLMKLEKVELNKQLNEQELANVARVTREMENYHVNMDLLKRNYDEQLQVIQQTYKQKLQNLRENLELRLKVEIHEVEERKNKHRNTLMLKHQQAYRVIKDYHNDITRGNVDKIRELQEEKEELQKKQVDNKEKIDQLRKTNDKRKGKLAAIREELSTLEDKLSNYDIDKVSLFNARKRLKILQKKLESAKQDRIGQETMYNSALKERDQLYRRYENTIEKVMQKADYKNTHLEQKLRGHEDNLLRQETKLNEVLNRASLDPGFVVEINKRIEDSLEAKNTILKNLHYSLAHAIKAYNDAIRVYEAKLVEFGIPPEELGFQPIESNTSTMPAGLVAA